MIEYLPHPLEGTPFDQSVLTDPFTWIVIILFFLWFFYSVAKLLILRFIRGRWDIRTRNNVILAIILILFFILIFLWLELATKPIDEPTIYWP